MRALPLVAQHELPARAGGENALGVRVATPPGVAFGRNQHMLGERGEVMTTEWTSIGRRLAVRRSPHRPPARWRKASHGSIVAPVAAIAATLALGVGVAMARAELDRRAERARLRRERRFGLHANERLAEGLKRMALGQLDLAIEQVECAGGRVPAAVAVHEARKALKRLRTLLCLLRDELGEQAFARESELVREAARRLAGARDAEVLVRTLDDLVARYPADLAHLGDLARLRAALVAERENAAAMTLDGVTQAQALLYLREVRIRVCGWSLADRGGITAIERSLRRIYRQGRRRMKRAKRGSPSRAKAFHEWRKRVKDLRYAAELLERPQRSKRRAGGGSSSPPQSAKAREGAAHIRALARRADSLGELLGEEHDLTMLAARLRAGAQGAGGAGAGRAQMSAPGRKTRRTILKLIKRRRGRLRKRALRQGKRVYRRSPKRVMAGVRRAHARARRG